MGVLLEVSIMDWHHWESQQEPGNIGNPYAGQAGDGNWIEGTTSIDFLQEHFGHCETLDECIAATDSERLKLFFKHLKLT